MNIEKKLIPPEAKCFTGMTFPEGCPSSITIHWIGPYPGQVPEDVLHWWISSEGDASAHFIIKDKRCVQCWETNQIAWHAGCRQGNYTSIGIEVIPKNTEGEFSEESIATLKKLLATLPRLTLVRHYDWTRKACPKYYCDDDKWAALLKRLGR